MRRADLDKMSQQFRTEVIDLTQAEVPFDISHDSEVVFLDTERALVLNHAKGQAFLVCFDGEDHVDEGCGDLYCRGNCNCGYEESVTVLESRYERAVDAALRAAERA